MCRLALTATPVTMIRLEGFDESVAYRAKELTDRLAKFGQPSRSNVGACRRSGKHQGGLGLGSQDANTFAGTGR